MQYPADGLAAAGNAPKIFLRTSRTGLPYVAVITCSSFSLLSYMAINTSSGTVFTWFSNMCATAGLTTWFGIGVIYLRFRKGFLAQGYKTADLPYSSRLQPFAAWWAIIASLVTLLVGSRGAEWFSRADWGHSSAPGKSF